VGIPIALTFISERSRSLSGQRREGNGREEERELEGRRGAIPGVIFEQVYRLKSPKW
jgi:ribosomal protein L25 (general stress protein Ctc)